MGIAERKLEEKQEMHKRILDGARKIFLQKGYELASMRNIAQEINYSPGSIYFYFKDKSEIFHQLHKEGFGLLLRNLKVLDNVGDPFERLKASGRVFIKFAKENKDYYNLMFMVDEPVKDSNSEGFQIAEEAIGHMKGIIKDCQLNGKFVDIDTADFTFLVISVVHGICALFCKHRTNSFQNKTDEELMKDGYECFVKLLEGY